VRGRRASPGGRWNCEAVMHADRRARVTAAGRGGQALTRLISAQRGLIHAAALA
jgi:hypothetical protein